MDRLVTAILLLLLTLGSTEEDGCYSAAKGVHSIANYSMPIQSNGMYPVDTAVTYHCDAGYENLTSTPRICLPNKSWTGSPPYCGLNVAATAHVLKVTSWNGYEYVTHDPGSVLKANGYGTCSYYGQGSGSWSVLLNQTKVIHRIRLTVLLANEAEKSLSPDVLVFIWKNFNKIPVEATLTNRTPIVMPDRYYMEYEYTVSNCTLTNQVNIMVKWPSEPLLFCSIAIFPYAESRIQDNGQILSSLQWDGQGYKAVPRETLAHFNPQCSSQENGVKTLMTVLLQKPHQLQRFRVHVFIEKDWRLEPVVNVFSLTNFTAHEMSFKSSQPTTNPNKALTVYEYVLNKTVTSQQLYLDATSAQAKMSLHSVTLVEEMNVALRKKVYNVKHLNSWENRGHKDEFILHNFSGVCAIFGAGKAYWEIDLHTDYTISTFVIIIRDNANQNVPNVKFSRWDGYLRRYEEESSALIDKIRIVNEAGVYVKLTYSLHTPKNIRYFTLDVNWARQEPLYMCTIEAFSIQNLEVRDIGKVSSAVIWNGDQIRVPKDNENIVPDWSSQTYLEMEAGERGAMTFALNSAQTISRLLITVSIEKNTPLTPIFTFGTFDDHPKGNFHLVQTTLKNNDKYATYEFVADNVLPIQLLLFDFNLSGGQFFVCSVGLYHVSDENVAPMSQIVSSRNGLQKENKENVLNGFYEQCSNAKGLSWANWTIQLNRSYPIDRLHFAFQINQGSDANLKPHIVFKYPEKEITKSIKLLGQFSKVVNQNTYVVYEYSVASPAEWIKNLSLDIYWPISGLVLCDISIYTSLTAPEEFCRIKKFPGKHILFKKKCHFLSEEVSTWTEANEKCSQLAVNGSMFIYRKDEDKAKLAYLYNSIESPYLRHQHFWVNDPNITEINKKCLSIRWTNDKPTEEALSCIVPNQRICEYDLPVCGTPDQNRYSLMEHDFTNYANYSCPPKFRIMGAPVRRCAQGRWIPQAPNCEPQDGTSGHINQFCLEEEQNLISFIRNTTIQVVLAFLLVQWTFVGFRLWYLKKHKA